MADEKLIARAEEALAAGPLDEAELARRLYGAAGDVTLWRPLLRRLLSGHDGFERTADGRWSLAAHDDPPLLLAGRRTRASGGRLVALAAAPADEGSRTWRWLFLPDRTVPGYVRRSARLDDDSALEAVPFAEVADEIESLLARRDVLVLDPGLPDALARELELCGRPRPRNAFLLLGQEELRRSSGKLDLPRLRASLGLAPFASDELASELEVLLRLADGVWARDAASTREYAGRRERLRREAASLPESPGVYLFRDGSGRALYVGSAVNLRRRVLSYFGGQIELTRGMRGLLESTSSLEAVVLGTHLEAVVEEARLIAGLRPKYNVQVATTGGEAWLRVGAEPPVNVVQVSKGPRGDPALYLGPLPNRSAVEAVASVLAELWGFRRRGGSAQTCEESLARLGELRALLREPERFLEEVRARLRDRERSLSLRRRAELASLVRRTERLVMAGELLPEGAVQGDALVARLDPNEGLLSLVVVRGRLPVACARLAPEDAAALRERLADLLSVAPEPGRADGCWSPVVARWLHRHRADPLVVLSPGDPSEVACAIERGLETVREAEAESELEEWPPDEWDQQ